MSKIIFRLPGEPEFVLDSEKMLETAKFFERMAAEIQREIVTRETSERRTQE